MKFFLSTQLQFFRKRSARARYKSDNGQGALLRDRCDFMFGQVTL
jgi:hypothetical protein